VVPNKVFQGAAAGCAIVTSDTPPQRRLLGDAAVLVPPGDARALADAIERLAGDPELAEGLAIRARSRAEAAFDPLVVTAPLVRALRAN
jgi:glycosyltransferase involved in cell wall biosynthesis